MTPTSGVVNTLITLDSSGLKLFGNLSSTGNLQLQSRLLANDAVITGNVSAGSVFIGSAQFTNISSTTGILGSAQIGHLANTSRYRLTNTNTSAGDFRIFSISSGRTHLTLNAQGTGAATPDVSGLPSLIQFFGVQSPAQITWQYVTSAGGSVVTLATLTSAGFAIPLNLSTGSLVFGSGIATNLSTNQLVAGSAQANWLVNTSMLITPNMSTNQSAGNYRQFSLSSGRTYTTLNTVNASAIPDVSGNPMLLEFMDNLSAAPQYAWQVAPTSGTFQTLMTLTPAALTLSTGLRHTLRTVTASTNTSANDYLIVTDFSSAGGAINLARAQSSLGQVLLVYVKSGSGAVTVFTTSTDQLGFTGASSVAISNETIARIIGVNNSSFIQW